MDTFGGWSTQEAAEPCQNDDDGLLSSFLCESFDGLRSDHGGLLDLPSPPLIPSIMHCHDGVSLSEGLLETFMGVDTEDVLPPGLAAGAVAMDDDGLLVDPLACVPTVVAEEPNATTLSSYSRSSTTGGNGNISSGESNACGRSGHDPEVASRSALPRTMAVPPSKRKMGKYPATSASLTTATDAVAGRRRGGKRASASSSSSSSATRITFAGYVRPAPLAAVGASVGGGYEPEPDTEVATTAAQVKEMMYLAAAMRPLSQLVCAPAGGEPPPSSRNRPRRKNVRISSDPQTVAARLRRERVSERLRVLQRLVPGGSRMDTASMLDEAASYLKFLKSQLKALQSGNPINGRYAGSTSTGSGGTVAGGSTVLAFGRDAATAIGG